jgi:hypothetical protein
MVHYIKNPDVILREEDFDGALLFNPDNNHIKLLNATGIFIWKLFSEGRDIPFIVEAVNSAFDGVPQDQVEAQVKAFVDELLACRFLCNPVD